MIGETWGTGQVLLEMLWFFLFFIEIWLMITVFIDLFRNHEMKGWHKALWIILVIILPLIGILAYLIVHGGQMRAHAVQAQQEQEKAFRSYVQQAAGSSSSPADELARLADLKANGTIDDAEFERLKAGVIGS